MKVSLSLVALLAFCVLSAQTLGQAPTVARSKQSEAHSDASIPNLLEGLRDKNPRVAGEAEEALAKHGAEATPFLEQFLKTEKKVAPRLRAATVLGEIKADHPAVVPTLIEIAKGRSVFDSEETLLARRAAGMFLARTPAGIHALPALLKDKDVFVRRSAAFALDDPTEVLDSLSAERRSAINDVLASLVAAIDDKDEVVSEMSCEVVAQIVRSKISPLSANAEQLLKVRGQSRGDCLCGCD